jgi:lysosomal Pro-X carboxypeptidase
VLSLHVLQFSHYCLTQQLWLHRRRYLMNDEFWKRPTGANDTSVGPIFFYTGNEGPIEMFRSNTGFIFDIGALCSLLLRRV